MCRHGSFRRPAMAAVLVLLVGGGARCASSPSPVVSPAPPPASIEQKVGWILRLEQQRVLRDADVAPAPPGAAGGGFRAAAVADLEALARDPGSAIRRRALLAIGRVGMSEGVPALVAGLADPDAEVRATAAFALGLAKAGEAIDQLHEALADPVPLVRARAVSALGMIGDAQSAPWILRAAAGCAAQLAPIAADDEEWPKSPEVELCRLSLFALVRLRQYDALAAVALDAQGNPVSRWWPVAWALGRIGDERAGGALLVLATDPGVYTSSFALRGLASLRDARAVPIASALAIRSEADVKARMTAVRALGVLGGTQAVSALTGLLGQPDLPVNLLAETVGALGATGSPDGFGPVVDVLTHPAPAVRIAALGAAARLDPQNFLLMLSGLGRDTDWSVRAALAGVLATLDPSRVGAALEDLARDEDVRVHGRALAGLVAIESPAAPALLVAALDAEDLAERAAAARLIGEAQIAGGAAHLVTAYERWQDDESYAARAAAIGALGRLGAAEALPTLRRALADPAWPVRLRAAEGLRSAGEADAEPGRPAPLFVPADVFTSPALLRPTYSPHAFIETARGTIQIELNVVEATMSAWSFVELARTGFFNGLPVHRVVPTFVIQDGDPRGDGEGGPAYVVPDELSWVPYLRGTVGMALDGRDTAGSQWFIALSPQPQLDGEYTAFGRVISGWDVLDQLTQGDVVERVRIWDGEMFR